MPINNLFAFTGDGEPREPGAAQASLNFAPDYSVAGYASSLLSLVLNTRIASTTRRPRCDKTSIGTENTPAGPDV